MSFSHIHRRLSCSIYSNFSLFSMFGHLPEDSSATVLVTQPPPPTLSLFYLLSPSITVIQDTAIHTAEVGACLPCNIFEIGCVILEVFFSILFSLFHRLYGRWKRTLFVYARCRVHCANSFKSVGDRVTRVTIRVLSYSISVSCHVKKSRKLSAWYQGISYSSSA